MRSVEKRHVATLGVFLLVSFASSGAATAATVCDLRTALPANTTCGIGSGLFATDEQHPTGTGFIDSFVRIQQNGWEQGYNTSGRPVQYNEKTDPNYTRGVRLSEVDTRTINGIVYREFFLDINEPGNPNKSFVTLDKLEIYASDVGSLTSSVKAGKNNSAGALTVSTKIYDMDTASSDNYVQLDYSLSSQGSGSSDLVFYLPNSLFGDNQYVYLYSQFGKIDNNHSNYKSNAGFEEWFVKSSTDPGVLTPFIATPEPASLLLLGTGLAAAWRWRQMSSKT